MFTLRRTEKRDTRREAKALKAAKVENAIEQELLNRLKQGTYGDIYNFDQKVYERVLEAAEVSSAPQPWTGSLISLSLPRPCAWAGQGCLLLGIGGEADASDPIQVMRLPS